MTDATMVVLRERGLWPHQAYAVRDVLAAGPGGRFLFADPPGTGKASTCAALVDLYLRRAGTSEPRILVVAPRVLLPDWHRRLLHWTRREFAVIDPPGYRRLEAGVGPNENPWTGSALALVSLDVARVTERLPALVEAPWSLIILDEAHLCTPGTLRGLLLDALWGLPSPTTVVALSATPHLGQGVVIAPLADSRTKVVRRSIREFVDWNGQAVWQHPQQVTRLVSFEYSPPEQAVWKALQSWLATSSLVDARKFALSRRGASSIFALEQSLRRLAGAYEPGEAEEAHADTFDAGALSPKEISDVSGLLERIEEVGLDSKWSECRRLLTSKAGTSPEIVMFCQQADTATYLSQLLADAMIPAATILGVRSGADRQAVVEDFRQRGGLLVVTDASLEGLDLGWAKTCLHYDFPGNPARLLQRFGRVHRLTSTPGAVEHFFLVDDLMTPARLVQKVLTSGSDLTFEMPDLHLGAAVDDDRGGEDEFAD